MTSENKVSDGSEASLHIEQSEKIEIRLPPGAGASSLSSDSDEVQYQSLRREAPSAIDSVLLELKRFKKLEELSWITGPKEQQNLFWLLRAKHAEALCRARDEATDARRTRLLAAIAAIAGISVAVAGWIMMLFVSYERLFVDKGALPEHLWQLVLATSGTVLLIVGTATLLFRVAAQSHHRIQCHSAEADLTRRIEVSVRLILSSELASTDNARTDLAKLGLQMINASSKTDEPKEADLSAVPDLLKELISAVSKVKDLKKD